MATIKEFEIKRNWGIRPTGNSYFANQVYTDVEKGQPFDLITFSINELTKPYSWRESIGVPCGTSEDEARELVEEYAKEYITEDDIKRYEEFLKNGELWGWD